MSERILSAALLSEFEKYLCNEEKSPVTIDKYMSDTEAFRAFSGKREISKDIVIAYKQSLIDKGYAASSVNSKLAGINSLLRYLGWDDCRVKSVRLQHRTYIPEEEELSREEYMRLLEAAKKKPQLNLLLQTICGTGIRVSELRYFTVEAARDGEVTVSCKNKTRTIIIPGMLRKKLLRYAQDRGIVRGIIFRTRTGRPLDRSNIWSAMKSLSAAARVKAKKIFPHNLRKLFARAFYRLKKDISMLADVLGHSSIETTRIYIMTTAVEHRRCVERLNLVMRT